MLSLEELFTPEEIAVRKAEKLQPMLDSATEAARVAQDNLSHAQTVHDEAQKSLQDLIAERDGQAQG